MAHESDMITQYAPTADAADETDEMATTPTLTHKLLASHSVYSCTPRKFELGTVSSRRQQAAVGDGRAGGSRHQRATVSRRSNWIRTSTHAK